MLTVHNYLALAQTGFQSPGVAYPAPTYISMYASHRHPNHKATKSFKCGVFSISPLTCLQQKYFIKLYNFNNAIYVTNMYLLCFSRKAEPLD